MSRPTLEVADIIRASGSRFSERHASHLAYQHRKVMDAIVRCRTAALGGHRDQCRRCGHQAISPDNAIGHLQHLLRAPEAYTIPAKPLQNRLTPIQIP
jgi:hypothetical protein